MRRRGAAARTAFSILVAWMVAASALAQTPAPTPDPAPDPTAEFFDDSVVQEIRLVINPKDWDQLKLDFQLNTYYACHFTFRGETVRNVMIRSRGTGSRSGTKPALRVDFNRFDPNQRFRGLKSVVLRNNTQDPTMLHERVAMKFFQRMGIPAPRETHARLFINDAYAGLYTIVETIDKDFLRRNYQEDDGHLYEYEYDAEDEPYYFTYKGDDVAAYSPKPFKPATHEKDPDLAPVIAMIRTINETPDAQFLGAIAEFLDVRKFMAHVAIENLLAETDGVLGNYAMNNFYFYRFQGKNLSTFIPWDKSHTFTAGPEHSIWHNIDAPSWLRNRLMDRLMEFPELVDTYVNTLAQAADVAMTPVVPPIQTADSPAPAAQKGWLEAEIQREYEQIREFALADPFKPHSNGDFEAAIQQLLFFARERANHVRPQVDRHFGR
jgi:hypothetical protein